MRRSTKIVLVGLSVVAIFSIDNVTVFAKPVSDNVVTTALRDYVKKPDDSFDYHMLTEGKEHSVSWAALILTSQTWRNIVWKHQLFIIVPDNVNMDMDHALLFIDGGRWRDSYDDAGEVMKEQHELKKRKKRNMWLFAYVARKLETPIVLVRQVPHQPIFNGKREDGAIAHTFTQYMETGDSEWPLLLPMVKSAVAAMDAGQEFIAEEHQLDIKTFTTMGASKRGWTTWLTAAADNRVTALAPLVIDVLNMERQITHQKRMLGGVMSEKVSDYTDRDLDKLFTTPRGRTLQQIIDPYHYRDQIIQPKLIVLGTNDLYWPVDAVNLYWDGLRGKKYILYLPNQGHSTSEKKRGYWKILKTLNALHRHAARGMPLPEQDWTFYEVPNILTLKLESDPTPAKVRAWTAYAPGLDFRKSEWTKHHAIGIPNGEHVYTLKVPEGMCGALFMEAQYKHDGIKYALSTQIRIAGDPELCTTPDLAVN